MRTRYCLPFMLSVFGVLVSSALAQDGCNARWVAGEGFNGTSSTVLGMTSWSPAPGSDRRVFAGQFTVAGNVVSPAIAQYDVTSGNWSSVGTPLNVQTSGVDVAVIGPTLYAAISSDPTFANTALLRSTGGAWEAVGAGLLTSIADMIAESPTTLLISGTYLRQQRVLRFDGAAFTPLGGAFNNSVGMLSRSGIDVYVVGRFTSPANNVARWDGTSWQPLGAGSGIVVPSTVAALGQELYIGGSTSQTAFVAGLAKWDGTAWQFITSPTFSGLSLAAQGSTLYASGSDLYRLDGSSWTGIFNGDVKGSISQVFADSATGQLHVSGTFDRIQNVLAASVARFDGQTGTVSSYGPPRNSVISGVRGSTLFEGDVIAAGEFEVLGGTVARNVARWDGARWLPMAGGVDSPGRCAAVYNNELYVGGGSRLMKWTGGAWQQVLQMENGVPVCMHVHNNELHVGGNFSGVAGVPNSRYLVRFDGSTWRAVSDTIQAPVSVFTMETFRNMLWVAGNGSAQWDGANWINQQFGFVGINDYALWNGNLVTARSSGTTVTPATGTGLLVNSPLGAKSILVRGNDLYIAQTSNINPSMALAKWNGTTFVDQAPGYFRSANIASMHNVDNEIMLLGDFDAIAGKVSVNAARLAFGTPRAQWTGGLPLSVLAGSSANLVVALTPSSQTATYQWLRNGVAIADGAGGASVNGGVVSMASGTTATGQSSLSCTIANVQASDAGAFSVRISDSCGTSEFGPFGLVVTMPTCDSIDFNADGLFPDDADLIDFLSVLAGGACSTAPVPGCSDIDFNNDGLFPSDDDLVAFLRVLAGGNCS